MLWVDDIGAHELPGDGEVIGLQYWPSHMPPIWCWYLSFWGNCVRLWNCGKVEVIRTEHSRLGLMKEASEGWFVPPTVWVHSKMPSLKRTLPRDKACYALFWCCPDFGTMRNKSLLFTSPPSDGILSQQPKQTKINEAAQVHYYVSKWGWPCFNKTLFTKTSEELHLSWKLSVVNSCCIKHLCVFICDCFWRWCCGTHS